ncbi:MAG: hypothetical protein JWR85_3560 [Marmoricola sp.]|nr:hypothetical protein [Marmoricola sp.]
MNAPFSHTAITTELARDTDLSARHRDAVARVVVRKVESFFAAPHPQELSQRNKEVMRAYNGVINDNTAQGRAARHVRDTLLARQELAEASARFDAKIDHYIALNNLETDRMIALNRVECGAIAASAAGEGDA